MAALRDLGLQILGIVPTDLPPPDTVEHLVVLQHGLHGFPTNMTPLMEALIQADSSGGRLWVVRSNLSSRYFQTHEGIDVLGNSLAKWLKERAIQAGWVPSGSGTQRRLSFVGHSLGGLITRYAIGILHKEGWFSAQGITLHGYVSCATPHLGVSVRAGLAILRGSGFLGLTQPLAETVAPFISTVVTSTHGATGRQLFHMDSERLLAQMASPSSCFMEGWSQFARRVLIISDINDPQVLPYSAGIQHPGEEEMVKLQEKDAEHWVAVKQLLADIESSGLSFTRHRILFDSMFAHDLAAQAPAALTIIVRELLQ